eukprot:6335997-Pyramimonas_sp.AAC.1
MRRGGGREQKSGVGVVVSAGSNRRRLRSPAGGRLAPSLARPAVRAAAPHRRCQRRLETQRRARVARRDKEMNIRACDSNVMSARDRPSGGYSGGHRLRPVRPSLNRTKQS